MATIEEMDERLLQLEQAQDAFFLLVCSIFVFRESSCLSVDTSHPG